MPILRLVLLLSLFAACKGQREAPAWYRAQASALKQRYKQLAAIDARADWATAPVVDPLPSLAGVDPSAVALYHVELGSRSVPELHHLDDGEQRCVLLVHDGHFFDHQVDEAKRCVTWMLSLRYVGVVDVNRNELSLVSLEQPAVRMRLPIRRDDAAMGAALPKGRVEARGRDYRDAQANANSLYMTKVHEASLKGYVAGARNALADAAR